jgi:hypothetical protein
MGAWSRIVPSQFMVDMYGTIDGKTIDKSSLYDPAHPFKNRDPRLAASIVLPGSEFAGYKFYVNPDSTTTTYTNSSGQAKQVTNLDVTNPYATLTGYIWRKYDSEKDVPDNETSSTLNFIYMRYAEDLLTYAEAEIEMGKIDQSVLNAINKVRARAYGVNPSQTNKYPAVTITSQNKLRKQVRYERTVEFADEGFRFFDIRRWGIAKEVMDGPLIGRPLKTYSTIHQAPKIENGHPIYPNPSLYRHVESRSFSKKNLLWAIPQKDIDTDHNLKQNPGY